MILKSLEISGFKSFANPTVFHFSFPIVAVVGPNGSGKSNVAEAFRFVLGEQSKKSLRSKSAEDLIWAGNNFKPKQNRARVALYFDNRNKDFDIDFEEVKIERVIFSDGANEYYINDSQVRLKDVQDLLASARLASGSHNIISQGEADAILNASDKDRLRMIKDALGLNRFILKINEAERKLGKTEENIKETQITLRELKPQMNFLEAQIRKKEEVDFLKEELAKSYAYYIYFENQKIKAEKARKKEELSALKAKYDSANQALENFKNPAKNKEAQQLENKIDSIVVSKNQLLQDLQAKERLYAEIKGKINANQSLLKGGQTKKRVVLPEELFKKLLAFLQAFVSKEFATEQEAKELMLELNAFADKNTKDDFKEKIKAQIKEDERKLQELKRQESELQDKISELTQQEEGLRKNLREITLASSKREDKLLELSERRAQYLSRLKNKELELEALRSRENALLQVLQDAKTYSGASFLKLYKALQESAAKPERVPDKIEIERIKIKLESLGEVGDEVIHEYKNLKEKIEFLLSELEDLQVSKEKTLQVIEELNQKLEDELKAGIAKIASEFNNFFTVLFNGGYANLELQSYTNAQGDSEDALLVNVKIPGKKVSSMDALSGGERSLVSIALIFAISQVSPPPFIVLDETDAALDEANSKRYSDILLSLAQNSQIITITHNRQTMQTAGELYGVTMGKDAVSQVLSITLSEAESVAK